MSDSMKAHLVRVGDSRGLQIPQSILDAMGLGEHEEVTLRVENGDLIVHAVQPTRHPREGWAEQFKLMAELGEDRILDGDLSTSSWDDREWTW